MLHAVYRVGNLDDTIEYYKKHFGLKQLRYRDIPEVPGPGAARSAQGAEGALLSPAARCSAGEVHQRLPGLRRRALELCAGADVRPRCCRVCAVCALRRGREGADKRAAGVLRWLPRTGTTTARSRTT